MMTLEDYELRLAVANQMKELATKISPVAVELANIGIAALNEQWQRQAVTDDMRELVKDRARLEWMATRGAYVAHSMDGETCNVWLSAERGEDERPAEGYPQKRYDDYRKAIDAAMKG